MPTKKVTKSDSKGYKFSENNEKKSTKKVVVKRRKVELVPTKASAVAIASQANRAKKQALIQRVASNNISQNKVESPSDTKIPLWVWVFFWCSLFFFCVSFYSCYFRKVAPYPQLDESNNLDMANVVSLEDNQNENEGSLDYQDYSQVEMGWETISHTSWVSKTAIELMEEYFFRLSNHDFDRALDLMIPALRSTSVVTDHFTSFRMNPFLDWIDGWRIVPTNFQYLSSPTFGRDRYSFDLTYVLTSTREEYKETWEFVADTKWDELKIASIACVTARCSYHPIFWPENFGLMK